MQLGLAVEEISAQELQAEMDAAWREAVGTPEFELLFAGHSLPEGAASEGPFSARPAEEGFGAIELILIAATGRLVASLPERLLVRLFDELVWPRLKARFGSSLRRSGDDA